MEVVFARCCGLDVHKRTVVACLLTPGPGGRPEKAVRTFSTMTDDLLRLADWLAEAGCTHVAMESTGVFWQPIWYLLEDRFSLLLANARHIKAVPGRKTDVRDCEWLADLLRHGLLRGSFVPDREQRELRELTRYRTSLVRERSAGVNRLQKTLEGANITDELVCQGGASGTPGAAPPVGPRASKLSRASSPPGCPVRARSRSLWLAPCAELTRCAGPEPVRQRPPRAGSGVGGHSA